MTHRLLLLGRRPLVPAGPASALGSRTFWKQDSSFHLCYSLEEPPTPHGEPSCRGRAVSPQEPARLQGGRGPRRGCPGQALSQEGWATRRPSRLSRTSWCGTQRLGPEPAASAEVTASRGSWIRPAAPDLRGGSPGPHSFLRFDLRRLQTLGGDSPRTGRATCFPSGAHVLGADRGAAGRILASPTPPGFFTLMTPRLLRLPVGSWSRPEPGGGRNRPHFAADV